MLQAASACCGLGGNGVTLASRFERFCLYFQHVFTFNCLFEILCCCCCLKEQCDSLQFIFVKGRKTETREKQTTANKEEEEEEEGGGGGGGGGEEEEEEEEEEEQEEEEGGGGGGGGECPLWLLQCQTLDTTLGQNADRLARRPKAQSCTERSAWIQPMWTQGRAVLSPTAHLAAWSSKEHALKGPSPGV